jgi:hypothetical protein
MNAGANDTQEWTFMVYMGGDNNLGSEGFGDSDINEMLSIGSTDALNIIVLYDGPDNSDTKLYYINRDTKQELSPEWMANELNLGTSSVLGNFLSWGMSTYPAKHYFLDIWGHGEGWYSAGVDNSDKLTMSELRTGLSQAPQKLDVIGFDACNMGNVEVFAQIQDFADIAVASEKEEDANGWPYADILDQLYLYPGTTPEDFSSYLVTTYVNWTRVNSLYSSAFAAVNLTRLDGVLDALSNVSVELLMDMQFLKADISTARSGTETYPKAPQPYDLYNLAEMLQENVEVHSVDMLAQELMDAIDAAVIKADSYYNERQDRKENVPVEKAHGMSISFPTNQPPSLYSNLIFSHRTLWDNFLTEYPQASQSSDWLDYYWYQSESTRDYSVEFFNVTFDFDAQQGYEMIIEAYNHTDAIVETQAFNGPGSWEFHADDGAYYLFSLSLRDHNGKLMNYAQTPFMWVGENSFDVALYDVIVKRGDGRIVDGMSAFPVEGEFTSICILLGGYNLQSQPVTVNLEVDGVPVASSSINVTDFASIDFIHSFSKGEHELSVTIVTIGERFIGNNEKMVSLDVQAKTPRTAYYIRGMLENGFKSGMLHAKNLRTNTVESLSLSGNSYIMDLPPDSYWEGDEVQLTLDAAAGQMDLGVVELYSADPEMRLDLDLGYAQQEDGKAPAIYLPFALVALAACLLGLAVVMRYRNSFL